MITILLIGGAVVLFLAAIGQNPLANLDRPNYEFGSQSDEYFMQTPDRRTLLQALGTGIARAEGYYASSSDIPSRQDNPGDLKVRGVIGTFGSDTPDNPQPGGGWNALFRQLDLILNGNSHAGYQLTDTLHDMLARYSTATGQALENYVAAVVDTMNGNAPNIYSGPAFPVTADMTVGAIARGDYST